MDALMRNQSHKKKGCFNRRLFALMVLLVSLCMLFLPVEFHADRPPAVSGYQLYRVVGSSMEPTFASGAILIVQSVDPVAIKPNAIITYQCTRSAVKVTTHRVKSVENPPGGGVQFVTRGDGNPVIDPNPVCGCELIGVVRWVVAAPKAPPILSHLNNMAGLALVMAGMYFIRILHQNHRNRLENHVMH
ncbi:signal peptidase I [Anoxynatronum buryatiense]|uniref:Signal peptidase I n=1 Tax=Anoxynatronum buryatiense TaxID=489973 RepID=A0AA45WSZ3_9CLOT|nr:signal peptidase I [Anoxynatronum buryatiense]SMP39269.1 Signal peptidase I Serine peptidase. MEROPS family S26B [Anoxynatronum buryatiense]